MASLHAHPESDWPTGWNCDLPLFPLGTVLFPDGWLPLRVFEARYVDMTGECLRNGRPFGVCLLKSGSEIATPGTAPEPETIGCLAEIQSCDVQQLGVMLLQCRGTKRFRLLSTRLENNGLLCGTAEVIPDDAAAIDSSEHRLMLASCSEVLTRIIDSAKERGTDSVPFLEPFRFDDASWVSNRLAEVLPISMRARQQLMELDDANARIELVHQYMSRHQLL